MEQHNDKVELGENHRLGALGFMHLPGVSPPNLGLMDQCAALDWVARDPAVFVGSAVADSGRCVAEAIEDFAHDRFDPAKVRQHGLDAGKEPIAPLNENRQSGIDFPQDMLGAVSAMRDHPVVNQGLGEEFVMVYCENKRQDHLAFMQEVSAREYRWFL